MENLNNALPSKKKNNRLVTVIAGSLALALTVGLGYNALASFPGNSLGLGSVFKTADKPVSFSEGPCNKS